MSTDNGSIFDSVLAAVIALAEAQDVYADILIGALPADNGISVCVAAGTPTYYHDKGVDYEMTLALNGKHSSQQSVSGALGRIHHALGTMKSYPTTDDGCQITSIETVSLPAYLDRESNRQWLYGSSLRVRFYKPKG